MKDNGGDVGGSEGLGRPGTGVGADVQYSLGGHPVVKGKGSYSFVPEVIYVVVSTRVNDRHRWKIQNCAVKMRKTVA